MANASYGSQRYAAFLQQLGHFVVLRGNTTDFVGGLDTTADAYVAPWLWVSVPVAHAVVVCTLLLVVGAEMGSMAWLGMGCGVCKSRFTWPL